MTQCSDVLSLQGDGPLAVLLLPLAGWNGTSLPEIVQRKTQLCKISFKSLLYP